MNLKNIEITHFRNISNLKLDLHPKVNVFFGENAQGKTSLVEAIFVLTQGKSFRASDFSNLIQKQSESGTWVSAKILHKNLNYSLSFLMNKEKKQWNLNQKKITFSNLSSDFCSVLFSPESLSIIKESDSQRRELIDEMILSVFKEEKKFIMECRQLLRQRNKFLKDLSTEKTEKSPRNLAYLEALTENYLRKTSRLCALRFTTLRMLHPHLQESLRYVFDESVDISVDYVISGENYENLDESVAYNAMYKRWVQLKSAEIQLGYSLIGPHKHDVRILFAGNDSRFFCSQGQQRMIILAFKMAQIRLHFLAHGVYPVLLLDDVLSELDEMRRQKLIEYLETINAQIFITTTERSVLNNIRPDSLATYSVKNGLFEFLQKPNVANFY